MKQHHANIAFALVLGLLAAGLLGTRATLERELEKQALELSNNKAALDALERVRVDVRGNGRDVQLLESRLVLELSTQAAALDALESKLSTHAIALSGLKKRTDLLELERP